VLTKENRMMSMQFDNPINKESQSFIAKMLQKDIVAMDEKTVLLRSTELLQENMRTVANQTKQPTTVEMHDIGDVKILSDGNRYKVTAEGWERQ
jgi:hypothetical protein